LRDQLSGYTVRCRYEGHVIILTPSGHKLFGGEAEITATVRQRQEMDSSACQFQRVGMLGKSGHHN